MAGTEVAGHTTSTGRCQRKMDTGAGQASSVSPFYAVQDASPWYVSPTSKAKLPQLNFSGNILRDMPRALSPRHSKWIKIYPHRNLWVRKPTRQVELYSYSKLFTQESEALVSWKRWSLAVTPKLLGECSRKVYKFMSCPQKSLVPLVHIAGHEVSAQEGSDG